MKKCNRCKNEFPATPEFFYRDKSIKSGIGGICKVCISKRNKDYYKLTKEEQKEKSKIYRAENKEKIAKRKKDSYSVEKNKNRRLKREYGITIEEYNKKFKDQNGKCEICGKTTERPLDVDHNHKTKQVRGLLCNSCNRSIANSKENPLIHIKTVHYLKKYKDVWKNAA